jgi:hypothetical protein
MAGHTDSFVERLRACLQADECGVFRLPPAAGANSLLELSREEMRDFLIHAATAAHAACIILDCGCTQLSGALPIEADTRIAVAHADGGKSGGDPVRMRTLVGVQKDGKADAFVDTGTDTNANTNANTATDANTDIYADTAGGHKILLVVNRNNFDVMAEDTDEPSAKSAVWIEDDPHSFESVDGRIDILLSGAFGTGIRTLADRLETIGVKGGAKADEDATEL